MNLQTTIDHIIKNSIDLQKKYYKKDHKKLDFLNIYTKESKHFDSFLGEVELIGKVVKDYDRGIIVVLDNPIEVEGEFLEVIQIAKPRLDRIHLGYLSYHLINFDEIRSEFEKGDHMLLVQKDKYKRFELTESGNDVKTYFTSSSFTKTYLVETDDKDKERKEELNSVSGLLEEEKQKRIALMADFQNFQKRVESEKRIWGAMANLSILQEILEIYDDLALAINDTELTLDGAKHSITSAQDKIALLCKNAGVERVDVAVGDTFDKEKMEAVSTFDGGEEKKGKVIAVISSAYKYTSKEGMLKPAKVVVGK